MGTLNTEKAKTSTTQEQIYAIFRSQAQGLYLKDGVYKNADTFKEWLNTQKFIRHWLN